MRSLLLNWILSKLGILILLVHISLQAPFPCRGLFLDSVHAALRQICPVSIINIVIIKMMTPLIHTRSLDTISSQGMRTSPVLLIVSDSLDMYANLRLLLIMFSLHRNPPRNRSQIKGGPNAPHGSVHQCVAPLSDVIHEVSVQRSFQADPGPATREIRKTISLPEECRKSYGVPLKNVYVMIFLYSYRM